jgi:hypothetical protein
MKKDLLTVFILLTTIFLTFGCGGKSQTNTLPPKASTTNDAMGEFLLEGSLPGMVRENARVANTLKEAFAGLKISFKEYSQRVDCYDQVKGFFVFSIKAENSEKSTESKCSFSPIIYVKKGSNVYRYWWAEK